MSLEASNPKPRRKSDDFLSAKLYVSFGVLKLLEAGAAIEGHPSSDHYANHLLLGLLDQMPEAIALDAEIANLKARAREAWLARQPDPSIPGAGVASNASATGTI